MTHPTPKIPRPDSAETRAHARADVVLAVSKALADPSNAVAGLNGILERSGYSEEGVQPTFDSIDDLVVAIAERTALYRNHWRGGCAPAP